MTEIIHQYEEVDGEGRVWNVTRYADQPRYQVKTYVDDRLRLRVDLMKRRSIPGWTSEFL